VQARKKVVKSRGNRASIPPGGKGFACPAGCGAWFDTGDEAREHGETHGLAYKPEADAAGCLGCLWDGCKHQVKVVFPSNPNVVNLGHLREHEARHVKGAAPRQAFICPGCDAPFATSAAAWECAETHGIERNPKKCLYDGCGMVCQKPSDYLKHEPVRVPSASARAAARERSLTSVQMARRRRTRASGCTSARRASRATISRVRLARALETLAHAHTPSSLPCVRVVAGKARLCCLVTAACKCGWTGKGHNGKASFNTHRKKCGRGAAPLPTMA